MNTHEFNHWLSRRQNKIDEAFWDGWFRNKETLPTEGPAKSGPPDPEEINTAIYNNPAVKKYADAALNHLGIGPGANLERIDAHNAKVGDFVVSNWATQNPAFYSAILRFVAGHILGVGEDQKSYLNISHHDAIVIIRTLDSLRTGPDQQSVSDELHIVDPKSLSDWMASKLPVSKTAQLQQGFSAGSQDFWRVRTERGKGDIIAHPKIKNLIDVSVGVVARGKGRAPNQRLGKGLWDAINALDKVLGALTGKPIDAELGRRRRGGSPPEGAEVDTADDETDAGGGI